MNSQWALVIRNDGEASVVPLADVSALQQDEAAIGDKNPTIIVLQTQEQVCLHNVIWSYMNHQRELKVFVIVCHCTLNI